MNLNKVYTDQAFSNSIIPTGTKLVFLGYSNGVSGSVTLRYKDQTGFHNITSDSTNAANSSITDAGNYFTQDTIQGALQQLGSKLGDIHTALGQITGDTTQTLQEIVGE